MDGCPFMIWKPWETPQRLSWPRPRLWWKKSTETFEVGVLGDACLRREFGNTTGDCGVGYVCNLMSLIFWVPLERVVI